MSSNNTKEIDNSQSHTEHGSVRDESFRGMYPINKKRGETLAVLLERFRAQHHLSSDAKLTYAGRLDPMAEGVVLILAGEDRFVKDTLLGLDKVYEIEVLLGIATDTQDPLGIITQTKHAMLDDEKIKDVVARIATITSLPYPTYSSVPVDGKPLFVHARAGNTVAVPKKNVKIYSTELLGIKKEYVDTITQAVIADVAKVRGDFRQEEITKNWQSLLGEQPPCTVVTIRVHCSSGTYMRSLATWVGEQIGVPALAYKIHRVKIGEYKI